MITYPKDPSPKAIIVRCIPEEKPKDTILREHGRMVFEIGVGKAPSRRDMLLFPRRIVSLAKKERVAHLSIDLSGFPKHRTAPKEFGELFATNAELANYEFVTYKSRPNNGWPKVESIAFAGKPHSSFFDGLAKGALIGNATNGARELSNTPGGDMTPDKLASAAEAAAKDLKIKVTVLGVDEMKKLGMGAIIGVGKGSDVPPRFIILEYKGSSAKKPIVLVGKGVTFDTGGLNLKPGNSINDMHMDMSGGSAVIHAVVLAARLSMKVHVVGLVPAVENMPSGGSYRPGDVLYSMSGQTIEIGNTDAEGRVILADALTYAKRYKPRLVIDVATLTGAACVALGNKCSALFSSSDALAEKLIRLGDEVGERLWRLPMWKEYEEEVKGTFGDWSNVGRSRDGGAINGAIFLYQFAKDYPWAHLDIAPRMTTVEGEYLAKGSSGEPVKLLVKVLEKL